MSPLDLIFCSTGGLIFFQMLPWCLKSLPSTAPSCCRPFCLHQISQSFTLSKISFGACCFIKGRRACCLWDTSWAHFIQVRRESGDICRTAYRLIFGEAALCAFLVWVDYDRCFPLVDKTAVFGRDWINWPTEFNPAHRSKNGLRQLFGLSCYPTSAFAGSRAVFLVKNPHLKIFPR